MGVSIEFMQDSEGMVVRVITKSYMRGDTVHLGAIIAEFESCVKINGIKFDYDGWTDAKAMDRFCPVHDVGNNTAICTCGLEPTRYRVTQHTKL